MFLPQESEDISAQFGKVAGLIFPNPSTDLSLRWFMLEQETLLQSRTSQDSANLR